MNLPLDFIYLYNYHPPPSNFLTLLYTEIFEGGVYVSSGSGSSVEWKYVKSIKISLTSGSTVYRALTWDPEP